MFLYLSKIVPAVLAPFTLVLVLLGVALGFRKGRTRAMWAAAVLLLIPSCPLVSDFLIGSLERKYPDVGIGALPAAEAIVVLGGAIGGPGGAHRYSHLTESSDRLLVALRLYRMGKAPLIVCSGGNLAILGMGGEISEAEVMSSAFQEWGVPAGAILRESGSENTHQNAMASWGLLNGRGIHRILLVTSAMHMPRAAGTFRKAGFEVLPAPADFRSGWKGDDLSWIPNPVSFSDSEKALREWLGVWVYRARGWAE